MPVVVLSRTLSPPIITAMEASRHVEADAVVFEHDSDTLSGRPGLARPPPVQDDSGRVVRSR